jgi:hypothetical protein
VHSDSEGGFRFAHMPSGRYTLRVYLPGWPEAVLETGTSGGAPLELVLEPESSPAARLQWRVRDRRSGEAITDFVIEALRLIDGGALQEGSPERFRSEEGSFLIEGLQPGAYRVRARAGGYAPETIEARAVAQGGEVLELTLVRERRVELSFVSADGSPLRDAHLRVRRADGEAFVFRPGAASDLESSSPSLALGTSGEVVAFLPAEALEFAVDLPGRLEALCFTRVITEGAQVGEAEADEAQVFVIDPNPELYPGRLRLLVLESGPAAGFGPWLDALTPEQEQRVLERDVLAPFTGRGAAESEAALEIVVRDLFGARVARGSLGRSESGRWRALWQLSGEESEGLGGEQELPWIDMIVPRAGFRLEARAPGYEPLEVRIPALASLDGDATPALVLTRRTGHR